MFSFFTNLFYVDTLTIDQHLLSHWLVSNCPFSINARTLNFILMVCGQRVGVSADIIIF